MKTVSATVRFSRHGEYENSDDYDVDIPEDTNEDDEIEVIMDALRPILCKEYEEDEDWENGDINWTLSDWENI